MKNIFNPHNMVPLLRGPVQQRFHCSVCDRNETLVVTSCPSFFRVLPVVGVAVSVLLERHTVLQALVSVLACGACKCV